ncbi:MAG: Rid family detoxifying hydrolase [Pseudomonadota bacterium]
MAREIIHTDDAPAAIGTYSQAVKSNGTLYLSGQIPLDPKSMTLVEGDFAVQCHQVFANLGAVLAAGGAGFADVAKLNIFLTDLGNFAEVNRIMATYFEEPYPARAAIGVKELPKGAIVEMDAIAVVD